MLDMGFIHDVRKIMALLPAKRQTLLFSATMPQDIASLAGKALRDPVRVSISPEQPTVDLVDQSVAFVEKADKRAYLAALIEAQEAGRAIVFTRTKHGADRLVKGLEASGISSAAIHANKSQNNRTRTMDGFRSGDIRILVATDLAARGIDVDGITHVYNYELPDVPETYVHRIGRTARAGASGSTVALCDSEEKPLLKAIEKLLGMPVPRAVGAEFEAAASAAAAAPKEKREPQDRRETRASRPTEGRARERRPAGGRPVHTVRAERASENRAPGRRPAAPTSRNREARSAFQAPRPPRGTQAGRDSRA
jgi:ATP-dependent RNA helicase RhlE